MQETGASAPVFVSGGGLAAPDQSFDQCNDFGFQLTARRAGDELAAKPVLNNTVTGNCASTVYRIAEQVTGKLPFDMRLLKTGGLPEYLDELGALDGNISMAERRKMATITARAQALPEGADFSVGIRTR